MLHPLFSTLVHRPDLVMDHVSGYAALLRDEASAAGSEVLARAIAWVLVAIAAGLFMVLTGTAIMLGVLHNQFHWVLVAVPGISLLVGVVALMQATKPLKSERFPELRAQLDSDARALRTVA